ncbi:SCO3242 family prenyltransferase [Streptomyces qinzhouensis]|uniref:Prenyltransferase n=1 Tax=Streptomyces qinzhouensis TaxID=2599401 RepID=A0A5B8JTU0_9ACTN|nr:UbiA family prenyltransferase [Streptomyces qinzhouensis]QDY81363.1 prenyltransferase [Streptomyces qinzhouensis]
MDVGPRRPGPGSGTPQEPGRPAAGGPVPGARSARSRGSRPTAGARLGAWAELLRISAVLSVPGDALAGAAARGRRPDRGTLLAVGASVCLYEAGMALNDWADRDEDAAERPHRPIPSGRITPAAALTAATALTATGLAVAARAGRPALAVAVPLAATVWAYDLGLKHTRLGPAAMATARALDLLMGATATATATAKASASASPPATATATATAPAPHPPAPVLRAAAVLGAHTYAVTAVSRHEVHGGSTRAPLGALALVATVGAAAVRDGRALTTALGAAYTRTAAVPFAHAALNPSPPLTERAVGGGIRAVIPLQALIAARSGHPAGAVTGLALMALVPLARSLARKVSPT